MDDRGLFQGKDENDEARDVAVRIGGGIGVRRVGFGVADERRSAL